MTMIKSSKNDSLRCNTQTSNESSSELDELMRTNIQEGEKTSSVISSNISPNAELLNELSLGNKQDMCEDEEKSTNKLVKNEQILDENLNEYESSINTNVEINLIHSPSSPPPSPTTSFLLVESNFKLSESQEPLIDSLNNYNILINQNKIDENDDDDESKKRFSSDLSSEDLNRSCQLLSNLVIYENEKDKDIMKSESSEPLIINDKNEFELRSIRSSKIENNIRKIQI